MKHAEGESLKYLSELVSVKAQIKKKKKDRPSRKQKPR